MITGAAVDGDDMVSGETDEVCSAWVCCGDNSNFGLVWILDDDLCMLSPLSSSVSPLRKHAPGNISPYFFFPHTGVTQR